MFKTTVVLFAVVFAATFATDLDDYVWRFDPNYNWVDTGVRLSGKAITSNHTWTAYSLNMTSQRWLTDADFANNSDTKSIWWHYLYVIVPDNVRYTNNATLWITGGSNNAGQINDKDEELRACAALAMNLGIVVGILKNIPNEHVTFASDPIQKSRTEDAIIAFTWDHFLKDPTKPEWLLRFPMVKASLRAMDTISAFVQKEFPAAGYDLNSYMVAGASKRGWTTWLVGAVDPKRVKAIAPVVLDAINFVKFAHHQWRSYGGFGWALQDYVDMNIMTRLDDPNMLLLQQQVDPYFYRDRLTMPKLIINAVLDEFQQPDDTHFWWNDMPEPKRWMMVPNAEHSMATGLLEVVPALGTWIDYLLKQRTVPEFTWEISNSTGEIVATLDENGEVHEASLWYAQSCGRNEADRTRRRDFRIGNKDEPCLCGFTAKGLCLNLRSFWTRVKLNETIVNGKRTYRGHVEAPREGGWVAFLIDVQYKEFGNSTVGKQKRSIIGDVIPADRPGRLEFTSEVSVWPQTYPYPDCYGVDCKGNVV